MDNPLTPSSGSLDAVTYFFVNSGVFVSAIAVPFFIIGLWLGRLMWGRFKRRFRESEEAVENLKVEVAQLKRRIAEQSTRPMGTFAHQAAAQSLAPTPMRATVFPEGNMLCLWTEPDYHPPAIAPQPNHEGKPFSLWTEPEFRPRLGFPPARAFSLWTADDWEPAFTPHAALPAAKPFSVWTEAGWQAPKRVHPWSTAFTLWTAPDWSPPTPTAAPTPAAKPFSLWTTPDWEPMKREHPWSCAFSLWTQPDWQPVAQRPAPLPPSAACSVWTEAGWEPPKRVHPWSHAFTVWTADDHVPSSTVSAPLPPGRGFSVWTAPDWLPPALPVRPAPAQPEAPSAAGAAPSVATIFAKAKSATSRIPVMDQGPGGKGSSTQRLTPSREMIAAVAASVRPLTPATVAPASSPTAPPSAAPAPAAEKPAEPSASPAQPAPRDAEPPAQPSVVFEKAPEAPSRAGFFAKVVAAAKGALGIQAQSAPPSASPEPQPTPPAPEPPRALVAPTTPPAELAAEVEESPPTTQIIRQTLHPGETSRGRLHKSQAFTIWTQPAWVPPTIKTAPIPRLDSLDTPELPREPKRQTLPQNLTGPVPVPAFRSLPTGPSSVLPAATAAVPLPVPGLFDGPAPAPSAPEIPALPAFPAPAAGPEAPPRPALYDAMVAKLRDIPASPTPQPTEPGQRSSSGLPSGTVAYMGDIITGRVRNDFLLGIVYKNPPPVRDDLTQLKGIADVLQARLNGMGIYTFKQIALWTEDQAAEFSARLGFKERAEREHWALQARELHQLKYGAPI